MDTKRSLKLQSKIRNATPNIYDGIKFRSKLETYTYLKLKEAGIEAEYEKYHILLMPAFEFNGKKYRAITYKPDFVGKDFIIECKGWGNDAWPIREKLCAYYFYNYEPNMLFYIVRNHKEVDDLIKKL